MKWYFWLMIGILLLIVVAAIYKANANKKAKNLAKNGDKCILSTDGNGMWLNGKCVSNAEYISAVASNQIPKTP